MQLYKYYSYYNNYVRKRMFGNRCNFVIYVFLLFSSFGESYLYPYNKMLRKPLALKMCKGDNGGTSELYNRRNILLMYLSTNLLGINSIYLYNNVLPNIEKKQSNIFYNSIPSVCYISTEYTAMADKYNLNKEDLPKGVGTGFLWDKEGHIITNFHVINKTQN